MILNDKQLSICAVIAARNDKQYLRILFPLLAEQDIDVVILDNESTDDSNNLYSMYMGKPIISVQNIPYKGVFSMSEILLAKQNLFKKIKHDWVIHHDADEIMEHYQPGKSLRTAIEEADEFGYTALNFDEFVFLPEPYADYSTKDYFKQLLQYYFFEPQKNRLNRAWKRTSQLSNKQSGGHRLSGDSLLIAPSNHILRHYIVLSAKHALEKYLNRSFDSQDLAKGWHGNRVNFTKNNLLLPVKSDYLFRLKTYDSKGFFRTNPANKHFWEWE